MASTSIYDNSVFKKYFESDDADLLAWTANVLTKLQEDGILAKYIDKGDVDDSDADFNQLEEPIVKFFGYLVMLAREFDDFKANDQLSNNYLANKGHYTSGDETITQLLYSVANLLRRRSKRGTIDNITPTTNPDQPHGEILSLLNWDDNTFFKLGLGRPQNNSWNLNNSSPLSRGTTGRYDLNVGYENTEDVVSLNAYPLTNTAYIKKTEFRGKNCIEIESTPLGQDAGIGALDITKRIVINPNYNFEITFYVAQDITAENLTFGVRIFDAFDNEISPKSAVNGGNKSFFFQTRRLNKAGKFYFVRGLIYHKDQANMSKFNATLNIGFGESLKFPAEAASIIPYIVMDNNLGNDSDSDEDNFDSVSIDTFTAADSDSVTAASDYYDGAASIYLWNIKVTPSSTDYERSYLNNKNFIDIIASNKNGQYNIAQIKDILRKYFIPYNTAFDVVNLPRTIEASGDVDNLLLESSDDILFENSGLILIE